MPRNATTYAGRLISALEQLAHHDPHSAASHIVATRAHKFVFDFSDVSNGKEVFSHAFEYGKQLAELGLMRLPHEAALFEVCLVEDRRNAFEEPVDNTWHVRIAEGYFMESWILLAWNMGNNIHFRQHRVSQSALVTPATGTCIWSGQADLNCRPNLDKHFIQDDNQQTTDVLKKMELPDESRSPQDFMWSSGLFLMFACVGLLNVGSGIIREHVPAPAYINKKRAAKGKPLLHAHTVVRIDYDLLRMPGKNSGGSHASPRVHWRRGHVRTLESGRKTLVRPCLVNKPDDADLPPPMQYQVKPASSALASVLAYKAPAAEPEG